MTRGLLVVLGAALVLLFADLGGSSIWDANEAFYVETPREMIERADYVVPAFNYEPRLNKPVLSYWMVAGLYKMFGVSVAVQRAGIAVGGVVLIACAMCLSWLAAGANRSAVRASLLAGAGLAVDPRLVMFSRRIFIDVWISAFMAMTLTFFALSEAFPARRRFWLWLTYASVGLGVLTKGPIALLLPAVVFAAYLLLHRELRRTKEMLLPLGILIVLAIAGPWYYALYLRDGWTPITSFFVGENIGRYTTGIGYQPPRGPAFYLPVLFADGFPLSLFLIAAARERVSTPHAAYRTSHLLWLWLALIVLFFSFSHDKQDLYILPVVPAVAALGAVVVVRRETAPAVRATSVLLGVLLLAAGATVLYLFRQPPRAYGLDAAPVIGAAATIGGLAAVALTLRRGTMAGAVAALGTLLVVNWMLVLRVLPALESYKPVPALVTYLQAHASRDDVIATYNVALPSMVYYLQRHVNVYYAPEPFVADAAGDRRMFGVLSEHDYAALAGRLDGRTCVLRRLPAFELKLKHVLGRTRPSSLVLITNHCEGG